MLLGFTLTYIYMAYTRVGNINYLGLRAILLCGIAFKWFKAGRLITYEPYATFTFFALSYVYYFYINN